MHRYLKKAVCYLAILICVPYFVTAFLNGSGRGGDVYKRQKYICPQGVLEGAIPLAIVNEGIRQALGALFTRKLIILLVIVVLSILFYRPFCKWICPRCV